MQLDSLMAIKLMFQKVEEVAVHLEKLLSRPLLIEFYNFEANGLMSQSVVGPIVILECYSPLFCTFISHTFTGLISLEYTDLTMKYSSPKKNRV